MKRNLLFLLFAGSLVTAVSCRKTYDTPSGLPPLSGTWYLQGASRYDNYGWQNTATGFESGAFTFYPNGDASYTDAYGPLYGNWDMYPASGGYTDPRGNYHQGYHNVFRLTLYDGNHQPEVNWQFDDCDYNGSGSFTATYYTSSYQYVYSFRRQ